MVNLRPPTKIFIVSMLFSCLFAGCDDGIRERTAGGRWVVEPQSLVFGPTNPGDQPQVLSSILINRSRTDSLTIHDVVLDSPTGDFSLANAPPPDTVLEPTIPNANDSMVDERDHYTLNVLYRASDHPSPKGTVTIRTDDPLHPKAIIELSVADSTPRLVVAPSIEEGGVEFDTSSTARSEWVRISNTGERELVIYNIQLEDVEAQFRIEAIDPARPSDGTWVVRGSESVVSVQVVHQSTTGRDAEAVLVIESNDTLSPSYRLPLKARQPRECVLLSDEQIRFVDPPVVVGARASHMLSMTNCGDVPISIGDVGLTLGSSIDFVLEDTDGIANRSLVPGETRSIQVNYIPKDELLDAGVLTIETSIPENQTLSVELFGQGKKKRNNNRTRIFAHDTSVLYEFDPRSLKLETIGSFQGECDSDIFDIAVDESGLMIAVGPTGVFRVDIESVKCTRLSTNVISNSLAFMPKGTLDSEEEVLIAVRETNVLQVDTQSGIATRIADIIHDDRVEYVPSGDVTSTQDGIVYYSTFWTKWEIDFENPLPPEDRTQLRLVQIDPSTGVIVHDFGRSPLQSMMGLAYADDRLFAFDGKDIYEIIINDGIASPMRLQVDGQPAQGFYGAAAWVPDPE